MRKYLPKSAALAALRLFTIVFCLGVSLAARIYLYSFNILMLILIAVFWTAGVFLAFVYLPVLFSRTVIYISKTEIALHSGVIFRRRELMRMSAVQYVTRVSLPFSRALGFNFLVVRGLGGSIILPFLRYEDCQEILLTLHSKISEDGAVPPDGDAGKEE